MAEQGFMELLNQGLGNVTGTPLGQLGMGLLMASGPQQGNPGFGQRLGQAFGGMADLQARQQLQEYRRQMIAQQQADLQMRQQSAQTKADQAQRQQQAFQNPDVLSQLGPLSQALAKLGVDPSAILRANAGDNLQAHRAAALQQQAQQFDVRQQHQGGGGGAQGPRMPTPRQLIEEPLDNGMMQKHLYDPATQSYKPYGQPFSPHSTRGKAKSADPLEAVVDQLTPGAPTVAAPGLESLPGAPTVAAPGLESLPGGGSLQSYAPQPQKPQGVVSSGAVPTAPKAGSAAPSGDLAAAKNAIAAGKSRQAVVNRLRQAGYSDAQIRQAGI